MDFFATFWAWLDGQLQFYISDNMQRVGMSLAPAIISLATIYVMIWGTLQICGKVDEPFTAGLKRIVTLVVVLALCWQFMFYNDLIVDAFYSAPARFATDIVGAEDPVKMIDAIWSDGARVAQNLQSRSGPLSGWDFLFMAYFIRLFVGILCVYTMFLIALSKVALAVLLALGPLFIVMLLFEQTRHYFTSWIAQLSHYAFVTILTVMVCALILSLVRKYAADTLGLGWQVRTADVFDMLLVCALAFLFMMQVPQVAASLGGGGAPLSTFNASRRLMGATVLGGAIGWKTGGFVRGLLSKKTTAEARTEWSNPRKTGYNVRHFRSRNTVEPAKNENTIEPSK